MSHPKVQIDCTPELLLELHDARDALVRARSRSKNKAPATHLERLIVSIHSVRARAEARKKAPPVPADAAG